MTTEAHRPTATEDPVPPLRVDVGDLAGLAGRHLGFGPWHPILQEDVTWYAEVTGDDQWIHVDPERAAAGPYGATVAHGFFTLGRFTGLLAEILVVDGVQTTLNYGLNRVRFPAPARVGGRLRLGLAVNAVEQLPDGVQVLYGATFEVEGQAKPACVAEVVFRYYPGTPLATRSPSGMAAAAAAAADTAAAADAARTRAVPPSASLRAVDSVFDLASRLLDAQHAFARRLFGPAAGKPTGR